MTCDHPEGSDTAGGAAHILITCTNYEGSYLQGNGWVAGKARVGIDNSVTFFLLCLVMIISPARYEKWQSYLNEKITPRFLSPSVERVNEQYAALNEPGMKRVLIVITGIIGMLISALLIYGVFNGKVR